MLDNILKEAKWIDKTSSTFSPKDLFDRHDQVWAFKKYKKDFDSFYSDLSSAIKSNLKDKPYAERMRTLHAGIDKQWEYLSNAKKNYWLRKFSQMER